MLFALKMLQGEATPHSAKVACKMIIEGFSGYAFSAVAFDVLAATKGVHTTSCWSLVVKISDLSVSDVDKPAAIQQALKDAKEA